ncbi:unnamed protein product, partial [Candidula unifasciata]
MSSNQEWSQPLEAGLHNTDSFSNNTFNKIEQNAQGDYLSASYGHSPQASPDSQQVHLSPAQHFPGFGSTTQDNHSSHQPRTLLPNTSAFCEQQTRKEQIMASELDSQQASNSMISQGQNEPKSNCNYPGLQEHQYSPEYSLKSHLQNNMNNSQADNCSNVPAVSQRLPQNHPSNDRRVHLSTTQQSNQCRLFNAPTSPHLPTTQIASPPKQTQLMPQHQQQQHYHNLTNPVSSSAGNMYPNNSATTPAVRQQSKTQASGHMQAAEIVSGRLGPSPAPVRNDSSGVGRVPQQQGHPQGYQQGMAQHKQEGDSCERMPREPQSHQYGYEAGQLFYGDEEEGEDMDDVDDERMEYAGIADRHGLSYPSSDSEELSEEETALLEELRCCGDDDRYNEIVKCLEEKGLDREDIEEMLQHSSYAAGMFPGENYNDENDNGVEAEGVVSSSSQGQTYHMRNQMRPHIPLASGQQQSRMYSTPPSGQNRTDMSSAVSSLHEQQSASSVPSLGSSSQDSYHGGPPGSTDGACQQVKTSGLQTSDSCPSAGIQKRAQGDVLSLQQQQTKHITLALGNPQKQVLPGNTSETGQSTFAAPQANTWQPIQNVIRAQNQLKLSDPRQSLPKGTPQPSHSQGMPSLRPGLVNKSQLLSQPQGQIGTTRPQGTAQSSSSSVVVRPVQHLTIITNSQSPLPGQGAQNRFVMRQTVPTQQFIISSVPQSQQSGFVGTSQTLSPVKATSPRASLQTHQKAPEQQVMPEVLVLTSVQQQGVHRSITTVPQSVPHQQNMTPSPRLRAVLNKETAPSEARLARLNVMYMQQSLEQVILAKKGTQAAQGQSSGAPDLPNPDINAQHRLPLPHTTIPLPSAHTGQPFLQKQQTQSFPAYQPKHQLPPRQPIPAIVSPNSGTNQTFSSGRPICSVVPFTSQSRGPAVSPNIPRQNAPQQNADFVRLRNPAVVSSPQVGGNPQQVGGNPQQVGSNPQLIGSNPQHIGGNLQLVGGSPQNVGGNSQLIGSNPQHISGSLQLVGGNPQNVGSNSQLVGSNPQVASSSQLIGINPQHIGVNVAFQMQGNAVPSTQGNIGLPVPQQRTPDQLQ